MNVLLTVVSRINVLKGNIGHSFTHLLQQSNSDPIGPSAAKHNFKNNVAALQEIQQFCCSDIGKNTAGCGWGQEEINYGGV